MPPQARLGDKALVPADAHGCPACPHTATGPASGGSPNVFVNGRPAIRVDDPGIHAACCGPNTWNTETGSRSVFINGRAAHRLGDWVKHCGGMGQTIEGSPNVIVGDISSAQRQLSHDEDPHQEVVTVKAIDGFNRKLKNVKLHIRCSHRETRTITFSECITVSDICKSASIVIEHLTEKVTWE
jgi:uncharacterized Zn-binding protein involved in type VI secretion